MTSADTENNQLAAAFCLFRLDITGLAVRMRLDDKFQEASAYQTVARDLAHLPKPIECARAEDRNGIVLSVKTRPSESALQFKSTELQAVNAPDGFLRELAADFPQAEIRVSQDGRAFSIGVTALKLFFEQFILPDEVTWTVSAWPETEFGHVDVKVGRARRLWTYQHDSQP